MKWGILGTGKIAAKFADQLREAEGQSLAAAGSRNIESAREFCAQFGGNPCGGYQELLSQDEVQAVYVSLPNSMHCEWTLAALAAGKHVLCEKPIASNREDAERMFAAAEQHQRVLVEAFMYRCHPAMQALLERIRQGAIGEPRLIRSHFTYQREPSADNVRYQAALDGGSLMDVGCYCINFSRAVASAEPNVVQAVGQPHAFGVDQYAAGSMQFGQGPLAVFTCGMTVQADRTSFVGGSEGFLRIDTPWFSDGRFDIVRPDGVETVIAESEKGIYALEAEAFSRAVDGEPAWITADDTLGNMRVLDRMRKAMANQQAQGDR